MPSLSAKYIQPVPVLVCCKITMQMYRILIKQTKDIFVRFVPHWFMMAVIIVLSLILLYVLIKGIISLLR